MDKGHDRAGCPTRREAGSGGENAGRVVQIVCPHCDRDNRLPRDWLRSAPPCVACRNALFEGRPVLLDDERCFDKHIRHNDIPVLTLFHTVW
jgi:thioredoxin 2